jgi:phosphoenolpyruvate phosphomutase
VEKQYLKGVVSMSDNKATKFRQFKNLVNSTSATYLMEAHNAISAKIVEQTGFEAIWASGLAISSSLGVRDRNEVSWTQILDVVEYMSDATSIPIMLDGDTGHGDFNNFQRLVKKLIQRDIAAVCIEDKVFPKVNSFLDGKQNLVPIADFVSKIKAGQDSKTEEDFCIVARTEALIAGMGVDETLRRAEAYYDAGADAVLIHSKSKDGEDVLEVLKRFDCPCPVFIVPTKYFEVPTERFIDAGVSGIIWANHTVRASIAAMKKAAKQVFDEKGLVGVEKQIEPLASLFELNGELQFAELESKYMQRS